jgi:hypothetical protein
MTYRSDRQHGLGTTCITGAEVCSGIDFSSDPERGVDPTSGFFKGGGGSGFLNIPDMGIPSALVGFSWMTLLILGGVAYGLYKVTR